MAFVVDVSASVGLTNVPKALQFVKSIVERMEMATGKARVALVTYSDVASVQFHLDSLMFVTHFVGCCCLRLNIVGIDIHSTNVSLCLSSFGVSKLVSGVRHK